MLSIGIVGLPNVGKSTLFNALTKKAVTTANYPFCTIDPSVGVVAVPDHRLEKLSQLSQSAETIPTVIEFVDIAGLVKGAHKGEGLGNKFLANIREVDAILEVVRIFDDPQIVHVSGRVEPVQDIAIINLELVMADWQTVSKRLASLEKSAKSGDKNLTIELAVVKKIEPILAKGELASMVELSQEEELKIKSLNLLTRKPILYVLNTRGGDYDLNETADQRLVELKKFLGENQADYVALDILTANEIKDLTETEKQELTQGSGLDGLDQLIKAGYRLLDLITFFTTGPKETRAWTVKRGSRAPEAGAAIHTDFQKQFIRAEVISYEDLVRAGSEAAVRTKGLLRIEGKDYLVQDGDVIHFLIG